MLIPEPVFPLRGGGGFRQYHRSWYRQRREPSRDGNQVEKGTVDKEGTKDRGISVKEGTKERECQCEEGTK
jgi:hypothetical protein